MQIELSRQRICIPINSKALITNVACRLSFNFIRGSCLHEQRAFPITQWRQNMNDFFKLFTLSLTQDGKFSKKMKLKFDDLYAFFRL